MAAPLLTQYTSYDQVRAVLGVDVKELADATLALELYVEGLLTDMRDVAVALPAAYLVVAAIAVDSRTSNEAIFYGAVKQFAAYAVAAACIPALPLLAPKSITDGKAGLGRFSDGPYKETIKGVKERFARAQNSLRTAYAAYISGTDALPVRTFLSAAAPDIDVVTDTAPV